jgi:hypothetical protein
MKVLAVTPGTVYFNRGDNAWDFSFYLHHKTKRTAMFITGFDSAHKAKQAMRERVAQERKLHLIGD